MSDIHPTSVVENPVVTKEVDTSLLKELESAENSKEKWYDDFEELDEPRDAGEIDERNSDSSDYEEAYIKRKKKKRVRRNMI